MKLNINDDQRFRIEVEYVNAHTSNVLYHICKNLKIYNWHYEQDLTLEHIGGPLFTGELISPILTNNDFDQIEEACKVLIKLNARTNDSCAAHIHFDSNILEHNGEYFQNFLLLYLYYENVIYEFTNGYDVKSREYISDYAKRLLPDIKISELNKLIGYNFEYKDFLRYFVYGRSRNYGVNFRNLLKGGYNTIEFRMPNGTLNPDIWFNNVTLFGRLLELSKKINPKQKLHLYKKILEQKEDLINYYCFNQEKEFEFLTYINNDQEDRKRFIKQYKKGL